MSRKYQIGAEPERIDPQLREAFSKIEVATIGHFRHRGFVSHELRPVWPLRGTLVGTAITVAIPGTDSMLLHHALSLLRPGDVLMIDRLGDTRHACLGGGVARAAQAAGAIAAVIDGPCTDGDEIIDYGFPVYSRGISGITTRYDDLGGSLNKPISCGNVPILPGDLVMIDNCGVLVISPDEAEDVLSRGSVLQANADRHLPRVLQGEKLADLTGATARIMASLASEN